jgi:hypothetical protein
MSVNNQITIVNNQITIVNNQIKLNLDWPSRAAVQMAPILHTKKELCPLSLKWARNA